MARVQPEHGGGDAMSDDHDEDEIVERSPDGRYVRVRRACGRPVSFVASPCLCLAGLLLF